MPTLRAEDNWTPILVLTAKDGDYDLAEALDTGADDFLSKPFSMVVLLARLRAVARRRAEMEPSVLRRGSLCVDVRRRTCKRGSDEIRLTPREFALLEHLVRQGDFISSKDDLLAEVWGPDFVGDPNIVEVYVRYLRKKLDVHERPLADRDDQRRRLQGDRACLASVESRIPCVSG